ncbi:hypothetical protein HYW74_04930 [Candidatus Pacearchaeota archaeon]|nr:hypothetical protein [Candidatus Pacearchaeota archaeon]
MALLEKVKQMKQAGISEGDVIKSFQEQGISPREINDAIAQSRIKEVISGVPISGNPASNTIQALPGTEEADSYSTEGMEPSLINQNQQQAQNQNISGYTQETSQYPAYSDQNYPQGEYPQYPGENQDQGNYDYGQEGQSQGYGQDYEQAYYGAGAGYGGISTETINEIANQMIDEKLSKTNKVLNNLTEFKIILDARVEKIDQRLQRIESIIDQLQTSLIRKSSSQTQDIEDIKNEMKGMQEGFSKVLNPLTDNIREIERIKGRSGRTIPTDKISSSKKAKKK